MKSTEVVTLNGGVLLSTEAKLAWLEKREHDVQALLNLITDAAREGRLGDAYEVHIAAGKVRAHGEVKL